MSEGHLQWIRSKWSGGARLLKKHAKFHTALQAIDSCSVQDRTSASLLSVWGALEQLFVPSGGELRFRVAACIAAYLEPAGASRITLFKKLLGLYNKRSLAAHSVVKVDYEPLIDSYLIARNALMKMVSENQVPSQSDLEDMLFGVVATDASWSSTLRQPDKEQDDPNDIEGPPTTTTSSERNLDS